MENKSEKNTKKKGTCCSCFGTQKVSGTDNNVKKTRNKQCMGYCFKRGRFDRCGVCFRKCITFLFSQIGLCSFVVGYSIFGGFIFMRLEAPFELRARRSMTHLRKSYVDELWNVTRWHNILHPTNWSREAERILQKFQTNIYKATKQKGWDGKDGEADSQWSFAGSLLYSITVITTIGYGHIAPKTDYGRLVTMVYALVGIPLTLLCLANLGNFLGECFRLLYKYLTDLCACMWCPKSVHKSQIPRNCKHREIHVIEEGEPLRTQTSDFTDPVKEMTLENKRTKQKAKERIRVPVVVSLLIVSLYIFLGAVIFSKWENWPYLIGSYFCFITLSTIGFGDYVPGADTDALANQQKQIICAFYLIFGLSIIAMSFNLMQEEVRAKCHWLGQKIGIIDPQNK